MKSTITKFAVTAIFAGAALLPIAANAAPKWTVNQRLENQHDRIQAGVRDHQLTRREQYNLDARDSRINTIEDRDRAKDDGHLTTHERYNLQHDLNRTSRSIYHDRRNGN